SDSSYVVRKATPLITRVESPPPAHKRRKPMGTTRRAVLKGTAAFAGLAAVQASGLAPAAEAAPAGTSSGHPKANVLLVHGAWVDGSSWSQVIAILQRRGHTSSPCSSP